jgi:hypothetical protein
MSKTRTFLLTGFIAGTLDILAASITSYIVKGIMPGRILQYIASAVFGKEAFKGGYIMMGWGLLFHYLIAFACVGVFFIFYLRFSFFRRSLVLNALLVGILAWVITNLVIVPLSLLPFPQLTFIPALRAALILVICIGLPSAVMADRFLKPACK